jgi:pimeloyl-[acyl-carrier protein] methyl ester esterase
MDELVVSDGLRMSWRERGQGPPLLLVHGWAAHGGFFRPQIVGLSDRFRVIAPDLRGHGDSPSDTGDAPTVQHLASDLCDLLAALDLRDVLAVGWSMGAMVLWEAALGRASGRFAGMVVEDMSPRIVNDADWPLGLRGGYDDQAVESSVGAMTEDWPRFANAMARSILAEPEEQPELLGFLEHEFAAQNPAPLAKLWESLAAQDFRGRLSAVAVPSLIIHGRFGLYDAETSRFLARELPNAERISFASSGHAPHLEEPERFNRTITEFHDRLTAPTPAAALAS